MKNKVFISYALEDREFAEYLKAHLNEILPYETQPVTSFDVQSSVTSGQNTRQAIKAAMDAANTVLVISSPAGDASQWVNYEAALADALGKNLVFVGRGGSGSSGSSSMFDRFGESARFIEVDASG